MLGADHAQVVLLAGRNGGSTGGKSLDPASGGAREETAGEGHGH
jgi:hypothetical protein